VTLVGGAGTAGNAAGGITSITGGAGQGSANGGASGVAGGAGGATGTGGAVTIVTGAGGATSGASGALSVKSGTTTSGASGAVVLGSGNATAGSSGTVTISTGTTTGANASGDLTINTGALTNGVSANGGTITIQAADGGSAGGTGGSIKLIPGNTTAGGAGVIKIMAAGSTSTTGGQLTQASGGGNNFLIAPGTSTNTAYVQIGNYAQYDAPGLRVIPVSTAGTAATNFVKISGANTGTGPTLGTDSVANSGSADTSVDLNITPAGSGISQGKVFVNAPFAMKSQYSSAAGTNDTTAEWDGSPIVILAAAGTQAFNLGACNGSTANAGRLVTIFVFDTSNNARTINGTNAEAVIRLIGGAAADLSMKNSAAADISSATLYCASGATNWTVLQQSVHP
jgi:hypothetical protein